MGSVVSISGSEGKQFVPTKAPPVLKRPRVAEAEAEAEAAPAASPPAVVVEYVGVKHSLNWRMFDQFYEENKERIMMPPSMTYPLDQDSVKQWVVSFADPNVRKLAAQVLLSLRHVSFAEFYGVLTAAALSVVGWSILEDRPLELVVFDEVVKSFTWVALLAWPTLRERVSDVSNELGSREDRMYVIADDASYSGQQLSDRLGGYSKQARSNALVVFLLAAVSTTARSKFMTWPRVRFAAHSIHFDQVSRHDKDSAPESMKMVDFQKHALYFDHKLADTWSTMTSLLAIGPRKVDGDEIFRSFIRGCEAQNYRIAGKPHVADPTTHFDNYDENATCPPSFYKTIGWTWLGERVPLGENVVDFISSKSLARRIAEAVKQGNKSDVLILLARFNPSLKDRGILLAPALDLAVRAANLDIVRALIEAGADPFLGREQSLFTISVMLRVTEILKVLLGASGPKRGESESQRGRRAHFIQVWKSRALQIAIGKHKFDAAKIIVESGADLTLEEPNWTPLRSAVEDGYAEMVKYLLGQGADPNEKRNPPLIDMAVTRRQPSIVEHLLQYGADPKKIQRVHLPLVERGAKQTPMVHLLKKYKVL